MVAWAPAPKMIFDSDPAGAAFLDSRSIGISESSREKIPGALAKCMAEHLGIGLGQGVPGDVRCAGKILGTGRTNLWLGLVSR